MAIQPTQPQGIGGVLDTAFQLYKASLGVVWPICLLLSIVASPPSLYMLKSGGANVGDPANALQMMAVLSDPVYWLVYLVSLALIMWVVGALYLKQYSIGVDAEMSLGTALQTSLGRAGVLLLMVLLFILAMSIGLVLLIIPGLIVMVSLMLSTNLVMFEGKGPVAALTGSHKLVWGNWWRTAAILTVGSILVMVIYMAVALVIGLITPFIGLALADIVVYSTITGLLVGVFMNLLVMPFFSALLISLYWDLKLRKEGGDLAARVGALNAA
jgi:hypothetical protein